MGSIVTLGLGGLEVDCGKNFLIGPISSWGSS